MADTKCRITMTSGETHSLAMTPEDLDDEILQVLNGPSTEPGWRFAYIKDSRGRNLRLNVDHIESISESHRSRTAAF